MGLFDKIKEPVFLKESSSAREQLEELTALSDKIPTSAKKAFERDLRLLKAGIYGEDNIAYELKNSHMPMWVIHDLYLEYEGFTAQIDYLIITRKRKFVVECKNLVGNIEVNSNGDFIRTFEGGRKEGLYSPITQNRRHMELIRKIRGDSKGNFLTKAIFEKYFYINYRSAVVLANPKTYLNSKYAKKETRNQIMRADQLVNYIRKVNNEKDAEPISESETEKFADYMLGLHKECPKDLVDKYTKLIENTKNDEKPQETAKEEPKEEQAEETTILCPKCGATMIKRVATRGANAGNEFYGCSNYPKCRCIINIK